MWLSYLGGAESGERGMKWLSVVWSEGMRWAEMSRSLVFMSYGTDCAGNDVAAAVGSVRDAWGMLWLLLLGS